MGVISVIPSSQGISTPTSTLIIHLENILYCQLCHLFPHKGIPVTPRYHLFFPVKAKTQFKKFWLLNSVSSAVALGPLARAEMGKNNNKTYPFSLQAAHLTLTRCALVCSPTEMGYKKWVGEKGVHT